MSTARSNRIPQALEPYLGLPSELSLLLLTSTLPCTSHWLTALHVGHLLGSKTATDAGVEKYGVVLVSWMRDLSFWTDEIRRTTGLDVAKLAQQGTFAFLDFLKGWNKTGAINPLSNSHKAIQDAISRNSSKLKTLLVLDNPDVLLAMQSITSQQLSKFILDVRSLAHSTIISCSADLPLVAAADQATARHLTPMEVDTATFLTRQAHAANLVMSVHELSSGAAKDISGTLRVTKGAGLELDETNKRDIPEKEMLYTIQRDGIVKVFGRGEGNT